MISLQQLSVKLNELLKFFICYLLLVGQTVYAQSSAQMDLVNRLSFSDTNQRVLFEMAQKLKVEPNPQVAIDLAKKLEASLDLTIVNHMLAEIGSGVDLTVPMRFTEVLAKVPDLKVTKAVIDKITVTFDPRVVERLANLLLLREVVDPGQVINSGILQQLPNDGALALQVIGTMDWANVDLKNLIRRSIRKSRLVSNSVVTDDERNLIFTFGSGFRGELTELAGSVVVLDLAHNSNIDLSDWTIQSEREVLKYISGKCENNSGFSLCKLSFQVASDATGKLKDFIYFETPIPGGDIEEWRVPIRVEVPN